MWKARTLLIGILLVVVALQTPAPTFASPTPTLSIDPSSIVAFPGSIFTISVNVSDILNMVAFDVTVTYDSTILTVTSLSLTGGLFDSLPHFVLRQSVDESVGTVRVAETLLAASVNVTSSAELFFVTFRMDVDGKSALHLANTVLVSLVSGQVMEVPHNTVDGLVTSPPSIELVRKEAKPLHKQLDISKYGNVQTLIAYLGNKGAELAYGRVHFTVVSTSGNTTFAETSIVPVAPGDVVRVDAMWTAEAVPDTYSVLATLFRSPDLVNWSPGETSAFSFRVVL